MAAGRPTLDNTPSGPGSHVPVFLAHRGRLLALATRVTGSRNEAEDVLQDAWVRWSAVPVDAVHNTEAMLVTIVTRLCLDRMRQLRTRREVFYEEWPTQGQIQVMLATRDDLTERLVVRESVTDALVLLGYSLSPLERVAFILRDVFGYSYRWISERLARSESAVRQLVHRARTHLLSGEIRYPMDGQSSERLAGAFRVACQTGDVGELCSTVSPDLPISW